MTAFKPGDRVRRKPEYGNFYWDSELKTYGILNGVVTIKRLTADAYECHFVEVPQLWISERYELVVIDLDEDDEDVI
jgi:hypothetical protein